MISWIIKTEVLVIHDIMRKPNSIIVLFTQLTCKVFQCSNIEDFQSRIIGWTSSKNSQATKRSLDFCMT